MNNFKKIVTVAGLIISFLPSQVVVANPLERGAVANFSIFFVSKRYRAKQFFGNILNSGPVALSYQLKIGVFIMC